MGFRSSCFVFRIWVVGFALSVVPAKVHVPPPPTKRKVSGFGIRVWSVVFGV